MYLKRITIKNLKCFADFELDFGGDDDIRLWTALLGQNGLGKSTLLQAIAAALGGLHAVHELLPLGLEGWIRRGSTAATMDVELLRTAGDTPDPEQPHHTAYGVRYRIGSFIDGRQNEEPWLSNAAATGEFCAILPPDETANRAALHLIARAQSESGRGWFGCGYGPFRRLRGGSQDAEAILRSERRSARFVTLFREDAALTNTASWLIGLHNTAREGNEANGRALEVVRAFLASDFFPTPAELHVNASEAWLILPDRGKMQFEQLSDGYRSMLAMGVDLLRWLIQAFPESPDPTQEAGVVLIDELDAHLHPTWQRQIGHWLRRKFPRLQFIIATHSPFLAQVAGPDGNVVMIEEDGKVRKEQRAESVHTWRVDQILTELYQLQSTYAPDVAEKLRRFQELYSRSQAEQLTILEEQEFDTLRRWQETLPPTVEEPEQRRLFEALRRAVDDAADELQSLT